MERVEETVINLFEIEAIKFGEFKLKSGLLSPIYINLRVIIGYPKLLRELSELLYNAAKSNGETFYYILCLIFIISASSKVNLTFRCFLFRKRDTYFWKTVLYLI